MNIFDFLLGIILITSSVLAVRANTSVSQSKRQTRLLPVIVIFLLTYLIYIFTFDHSLALVGIYFLIFTAIWPLLISFLINQRAIEQPIGTSKINISMFGAALIMGLMTLMFMVPNRISFSSGKPIIDSEYLVSRVSFLLASIPAIILYILLAIKKTIFHRNGIFHQGLLWAWSDFESYQWKNENPQKKEFVLLLSTKNLWFNKQVRLIIASDQKDYVNALLAKEV